MTAIERLDGSTRPGYHAGSMKARFSKSPNRYDKITLQKTYRDSSMGFSWSENPLCKL